MVREGTSAAAGADRVGSPRLQCGVSRSAADRRSSPSPRETSATDPATDAPLVRIGCPVWACEHWRGNFYTRKARRTDFLKQYSVVFDTVEGNSTFYALPTAETVARWASETAEGFRFSLKVPRAITHDHRLRNAAGPSRAFLDLLDVLAQHDRLGQTFLQLPPDFDASEFEALRAYLKRWPREIPLAVEPRHRDWFAGDDAEQAFDHLLAARGCERVLLDSRALYANPPETEHERVSQTRKPRVPRRTTVIDRQPFVRFIGRDDVSQAEPWIEEWAEVTAGWIARGYQPTIFCHAPDDTFAPAFCRRFHAALQSLVPKLPDLPAFPAETEEVPAEQLSLF